MSWVAIVMIAFIAFGTLSTIGTINKPRDPITPTMANFIVFFQTLFVMGILYLDGVIG